MADYRDVIENNGILPEGLAPDVAVAELSPGARSAAPQAEPNSRSASPVRRIVVHSSIGIAPSPL